MQLKRAWLIEELKRDGDIKVFSGICGHAWTIGDVEKKNLRKALAEGLT